MRCGACASTSRNGEQEGDRVFVTVSSAKPIDERMSRYLDRSDAFENARVESKSADGLKIIMSADGRRSSISCSAPTIPGAIC